MSMMIARPNGKSYRPRAIRCVPLCQDEDSPIDSVLVLGTHDIQDAYARAVVAIADEARKVYDDPEVYTLVVEQDGRRGWWSRKFWGFYEDWPMYTYPEDEEHGAAGVQFTVNEIERERVQP